MVDVARLEAQETQTGRGLNREDWSEVLVMFILFAPGVPRRGAVALGEKIMTSIATSSYWSTIKANDWLGRSVTA